MDRAGLLIKMLLRATRLLQISTYLKLVLLPFAAVEKLP